jgi:hypothetical protein
VSDENPPSQGGAILIGTLMMVAGIGIFALGIAGREGSLNAPRWVVACAGGACLVFGLWIVTICSRGYDPRHPEVSPPPPALQRLFFIPGMLLFAAPFHWIAFGPGPRRFSTTFSIPFFAREGTSTGLSGRIAFGIGALLLDAILVAGVIGFSRRAGEKP